LCDVYIQQPPATFEAGQRDASDFKLELAGPRYQRRSQRSDNKLTETEPVVANTTGPLVSCSPAIWYLIASYDYTVFVWPTMAMAPTFLGNPTGSSPKAFIRSLPVRASCRC